MIYFYLILYATILLFGANELGIGPNEAKIIFTHPWLSWLFTKLYSLQASELVVRLPVIFVSLVNVALFYRLSQNYLRQKDALFSTILFSLLPAVLGAAVIINKAPFIIFLTLIFLLFFSYENIIFIYAFFLIFVDKAFAILFLSVSLYFFYKKHMPKAWAYLGLFILSIYLYGFDIGGKPKSFFLDTFAVFSAIFSPLLFFYYFYAIYRVLVKERKDLLWFVSATPFLFALLLSFRQKIYLIDFAPFAVIGVIVMVKLFLHSYRVRLPKYRRKFRYALAIVLVMLLLNDMVLLMHGRLLTLLPTSANFVKNYYIGKLLASELLQRGITCIDAQNELALQLRFYGIENCKNYSLSKTKGDDKIVIAKDRIHFATFYVTKRDRKKE